MHDNNETSYYEIALTNRQVVVAFVLVLGSVLAAFLSGVWIGRQDGGSRFAQRPGEEPVAGVEVADLDPIDGFFSDEDPSLDNESEDLDTPDLSGLLDEPRQGTTLAEDVGADNPASLRARDAGEVEGEVSGAAPPGDDMPLWKKRALARKAEQEEAERRQRSASTPPPPPPAALPPPSPPAASTPPAPSPPVVVDGFVIQVVSTHDEPKARYIHDQLEDSGFEVFMSPIEVEGRSMYRVRIGPFVDRDAADEVAKSVNARFKLDTWVTAASH